MPDKQWHISRLLKWFPITVAHISAGYSWLQTNSWYASFYGCKIYILGLKSVRQWWDTETKWQITSCALVSGQLCNWARKHKRLSHDRYSCETVPKGIREKLANTSNIDTTNNETIKLTTSILCCTECDTRREWVNLYLDLIAVILVRIE